MQDATPTAMRVAFAAAQRANSFTKLSGPVRSALRRGVGLVKRHRWWSVTRRV